MEDVEEYPKPVWKPKLTMAEWLAEQSGLVQDQYNGWIRLMTKCDVKGRYSDKKYRMMPKHIFDDFLNDFLVTYKLKSDENFLEELLKLLSRKD